MDIGELLREFGGILGTATLLASVTLFLILRGKAKENTKLLTEQNQLLREDKEDNKTRYDESMARNRDEKKDLLEKLSASAQINMELGQRIAVMEGIVTAKADIKDFRTLFEDALAHFTAASLQAQAEHLALATDHKVLSQEHKEIKDVLQSVDKKVDNMAEDKK